MANLRQLSAEVMQGARENVERLGYADFAAEAGPSGITLVCMPGPGPQGFVDVEGRGVRDRLGEIRRVLAGAVEKDDVEGIHRDLITVRLHSEDRIASILWLLLRHAVGYQEGQAMTVSRWWS